MKHQIDEEQVGNIFDSYCKRCLKRNLLDLKRKEKQQADREVNFSEMPVSELSKLATTDMYFKDEHVFDVLGKSIGVSDSDLAEALSALPLERREIVLMSYFCDMTDNAIADNLNLARRTVAYRRARILTELKKLMERED